MKCINLILTACFICLGYSQTDTLATMPNKYYLGTTFHGKDVGLIFGHFPTGLEFGVEFRISDVESAKDESHAYTYNESDDMLIEESGSESTRDYDYKYDYRGTLSINKRMFYKQSGYNTYSLYTGLSYYINKNANKYSYVYTRSYPQGDYIEQEYISSYTDFSIKLGAKIENRIMKKVAFEIEYNIEIGYVTDENTQKSWYYDENDVLDHYNQNLSKTSEIYTDLGSPRIIIKYYF